MNQRTFGFPGYDSFGVRRLLNNIVAVSRHCWLAESNTWRSPISETPTTRVIKPIVYLWTGARLPDSISAQILLGDAISIGLNALKITALDYAQ
jgi:hypothetical protein